MTKIAELQDKGAVVAWSPMGEYADVVALGSKVCPPLSLSVLEIRISLCCIIFSRLPIDGGREWFVIICCPVDGLSTERRRKRRWIYRTILCVATVTFLIHIGALE